MSLIGGGTAISVAAIALARGAAVDELDPLWDTMRNWHPPITPAGVVADVDRALKIIREKNGAQR